MDSLYPPAYERDRQGAVISEDGRYRYVLWRDWDPRLPVATWIMLNPSTADALQDDPTIRRVVRFSADNGFGSAEVVNLYALRTPSPSELRKVSEFTRYGPENTKFVKAATPPGRTVVCAWGTNGGWRIPESGGATEHLCLGTNRDGSPIHPLYVAKSRTLEQFR